jgi:hypothetical protein
MAVLSFSLTPEATGRIYEALVCLAKFGEAVAIEARGDKASFLDPTFKYQTQFTNMLTAHTHGTESIKNGLCFFRARRAIFLHQLYLQRQQPIQQWRSLHLSALQSGTAVCLQRSHE